MEYETVKQKEKKISVKICKGSIWEELKESLNDRKCYDDKKNEKKKLTVDVNVKREFRSTNENNVKDDSWMNRIKSALSRGKYQDQISTDKKDSANKQQKKDASKIKQVDKKPKEEPKGAQEPEKIHEPDVVKEESQNILSQTKKRISGNKNKEQIISETIKSKKVTKVSSHDDEIKDKQKIAKLPLATASGDANKDKEKYPLANGLKSSRQKGNKYEVQINNNVVVMNPNDSDEDPKDAEDRAKRRQITKDKRSKSKPATAKEKWSESFQGKKLDSVNEPTLEAIKNLKSSILSLRVIDKKMTKTSNEKDKLKEYRNKREEDKKKRRKVAEEMNSTSNELEDKVFQALQAETSKTDLREVISEKKKKNVEDVQNDRSSIKENVNDKCQTNSKKRKEMKGKTKENSRTSSNTTIERASSKKLKSPSVNEDGAGINILSKEEKAMNSVNNLVNGMLMDDEPIESSSCYSGSSSSDEHECSCGCMDSNAKVCREMYDSSPSSSSSIEYLRSYSGNLIMCAHGKKPVLSEHIRYLSSCIKL